MSNRFFTSDTHFGHQRIIELCNRPFSSFEEMDEALIDNWNHVVYEDDVVYHLGDVALGQWDRWNNILPRLNGRKILVVGNHDRVFCANKQSHIDRFKPIYDLWFEEIHDNISGLTLLNGEGVNLSHFPYDGDSHGDDRYREYRLHDNANVLIHGHTHSADVISRSKIDTVQIHVGVDAHNYTPVSEQQVIDYIRIADDLKE